MRVKEENKENGMQQCAKCGKMYPMNDNYCSTCGAKSIITNKDVIYEADDNGTFKCPTCGSKVLKKTGYCLKCKKKVKEPGEKKKEEVIILDKDVKIGNVILEKGDQIIIL